TMYAIMLTKPELKTYDLSSLKLAILSGEKLETELLEQIHNNICSNLLVGYGSTEAGSEVTFTEPGEDFENIAKGYVGKPLPGYQIKIVDDNDNNLPAEKEGEVLVKGDFTIKKYFKMPQEDKEGFTADGYCRTGDLGYLTPDGGLYIKGRKKHIVRVGSYTVMPSEVEEIVTQDPSVGLAAAIGVPDKILGEVVWLVVSPAAESVIDADKLIKICENQLAQFKVPKHVIVKDNLPVTHIGKINRIQLQNEIIKEIKGGLYEQ
ncbi:MAG: long-chain fatty acid--CoA ligase, partial [Thiotrichaceae bacterium]|nr:long-chain fatty acid--CoA ligase [Thiotrichaceae bacterium]